MDKQLFLKVETELNRLYRRINGKVLCCIEPTIIESIDSYTQYISTYCDETQQEPETALTRFDKEQGVLAAKGIAREDFLLVRDMLQAATSASL